MSDTSDKKATQTAKTTTRSKLTDSVRRAKQPSANEAQTEIPMVETEATSSVEQETAKANPFANRRVWPD